MAPPLQAPTPRQPTTATPPTQPPPSAPSPRLPETDPAYNEVVLSFLRKRGYHQAEEMLRKEIAGTTASATTSTSNPNPSTGSSTVGSDPSGNGGHPPQGGASRPLANPSTAYSAPNKSNTTNLPNLIQRNNMTNGPPGRPVTPGAGGPTGRSGTPPPVISSQLFDVMLQHLPSSALTTLGLTPPAATLERERKEKEEKDRAGRILNGPVAGNAVRVLEPGERITGYDGLRAWVESGLEGWKVSFWNFFLLVIQVLNVHCLALAGRVEAVALPCVCPYVLGLGIHWIPSSRSVPNTKPRTVPDLSTDPFPLPETIKPVNSLPNIPPSTDLSTHPPCLLSPPSPPRPIYRLLLWPVGSEAKSTWFG